MIARIILLVIYVEKRKNIKLTKPQKLIYEMDKFVGGAISVICGSMLVKGTMETDRLKNAVNELYRLNDALRIRILEDNGDVCQKLMLKRA